MLLGTFKGKPTRLSPKWEREPMSVSCKWEKTQQPILNESPLLIQLCEVGSGNPSTCVCCYLSAFSWMTFSCGLQINKGRLGVLTPLLKTHINLQDLDDSCFHSDCAKQTFPDTSVIRSWHDAMFSFRNVWRLIIPGFCSDRLTKMKKAITWFLCRKYESEFKFLIF